MSKLNPRFKDIVLERDGYKCRECSTTRHLTMHHKLSLKRHPELRTDLNNVITLCRFCHDLVHNCAKRSTLNREVKRLRKELIKLGRKDLIQQPDSRD